MSFSKPIEPPSGVELMKNADGTINTKYIDLLDEDRDIAGQKFVCLSFVSPEHILKQKDMFLFEEFIKNWDFSKSMQKFSQFLNFISFKYHLDFDKLTTDFQEFTKDERDKLIATTIEDDYKNFLDEHEDTSPRLFWERTPSTEGSLVSSSSSSTPHAPWRRCG